MRRTTITTGHTLPRVVVVLAVVVLAACATAPGGFGSGAPTGVVRDSAPFDVGVIDEIDRKVAERHSSLRALLVAVGDDVVLERYYGGTTRDDHAEVFSVTKSVVSMLVGIAIDDGAIEGVHQTVDDLLADHLSRRTPADVRKVTLEQLLTMTSGFPPDPPNQDLPYWGSEDWARSILRGGTFVPPGTMFSYSNASAHLLSVLITDATGQSTLSYARDKLFDPLGIDTRDATRIVVDPDRPDRAERQMQAAGFAWGQDPQGYYGGMTGLKLKPVDMLKLGQLYLRGGQWDGRQLVPSDYVAASTRPADINGASRNYGYQWWLNPFGDHDSFAASGYGGQAVIVVPDLEVVIVTASALGDDGQAADAGLESLLIYDVLPPLTTDTG